MVQHHLIQLYTIEVNSISTPHQLILLPHKHTHARRKEYGLACVCSNNKGKSILWNLISVFYLFFFPVFFSSLVSLSVSVQSGGCRASSAQPPRFYRCYCWGYWFILSQYLWRWCHPCQCLWDDTQWLALANCSITMKNRFYCHWLLFNGIRKQFVKSSNRSVRWCFVNVYTNTIITIIITIHVAIMKLYAS